MIDSILDRSKQSIVINKLLVKQDDDVELITDHNKIKNNVRKHFQTYALPYNYNSLLTITNK